MKMCTRALSTLRAERVQQLRPQSRGRRPAPSRLSRRIIRISTKVVVIIIIIVIIMLMFIIRLIIVIIIIISSSSSKDGY